MCPFFPVSDASGSWGAGAWHGRSWFQVQWEPQAQPLPIAEKEFIPILACVAWGSAWEGRSVVCHCDNQVVIACMKSHASRTKGLMHLLRCLAFTEANINCHLSLVYMDTRANHLADNLSCNLAYSFLSKVPEVDPGPTPISLPLLDLLLDQEADWTSPHWCHLFSDTFRQA